MVRQEHVAALGSIAEPMTIAGRVAFWLELRSRLDRLSNRIGDSQIKILDAVHARIPMVTVDEQRELQRQNAEADAKFWESLEDLNRATAEDNKGLAEMASRTAATAETVAQDAAKKAATAKERIARLNNGETLTGGLGAPRELTRQDFIRRGFPKANCAGVLMSLRFARFQERRKSYPANTRRDAHSPRRQHCRLSANGMG